MCKWADKNPKLYGLVYGLIMQGETYRGAAALLANMLAQSHPDVKPPRAKTIWHHFKNHMSPEENDKIALIQQARKAALASNPTLTKIPNKSILNSPLDTSEKSDLTELWDLYGRSKAIIDNSFVETKDEFTGQPIPWSPQKMQTFLQAANTLRSIIVDLSKLRSSEQMILAATKYIIEVFTTEMVNKLSSEYMNFRSQLQRAGVPQTIVDNYDHMTKQRMVDIILGEAKNAMKKTSDEFKFIAPLN